MMKFIEIIARIVLLVEGVLFYIGFAWFVSQKSTIDNLALLLLILIIFYASFMPLKYYNINLIVYIVGIVLLLYNLIAKNLSTDFTSGLFYLGTIIIFASFAVKGKYMSN